MRRSSAPECWRPPAADTGRAGAQDRRPDGYQWGRYIQHPVLRGGIVMLCQQLDGMNFRLLYGGIDSDGITERARNMTTVMAGVAKRHAVRTSCPVVLKRAFSPAGRGPSGSSTASTGT